MPIDFSIQQQTIRADQSMAGSTSSAAATGSLFGNTATVAESPMSLLADAAEELTFGVDTTDEFELDERKERDEIDESLSERIKMYQQLMTEKGASQELNQLKDAIRSKEGREQALRQAREHFHDPSDAWAALKSVYEDLEKDPTVSQATLDGVKEALDTLDAENGPAIRAGIQGALAARDFAGVEKLGGGDELRSLYRQTVCNFTDVNDLYTHIESKYGDNFELALNFLYKALANDLATDVPSMETRHLESVNANLGELRSLQSAHSLCATLMDRWAGVHGVEHCDLDAMKLLGRIVDLRKEHFLGAAQVNTIAADAKAPDIEHKVLFLQELLNTTRSFSPTLFDGSEGRMKVLDAVQDAVDAAIAEEDVYLANLE